MNAMDHPPQVHVHDRLPIRKLQVTHFACQPHAGVIEDQVNSTKFFGGRLHGLLHFVIARDVGLTRRDATATRGQVAGQPLSRTHGQVSDQHRGSCSRQLPHQLGANARRATRYDGYFIAVVTQLVLLFSQWHVQAIKAIGLPQDRVELLAEAVPFRTVVETQLS
jgi:hypothetical protein